MNGRRLVMTALALGLALGGCGRPGSADEAFAPTANAEAAPKEAAAAQATTATEVEYKREAPAEPEAEEAFDMPAAPLPRPFDLAERKPSAGPASARLRSGDSRNARGDDSEGDDLDQVVDGKLLDALDGFRGGEDGLLGGLEGAAGSPSLVLGAKGEVDKGGGSPGLPRPEPSVAPAVTMFKDGVDALEKVRPATFLPRTFYFENTYLGGSAAYAERLRKLDAALGEGERPYRLVAAEAQPFDPPARDGLGLHASVDATHLEDPRRVFLQVGIQGSRRYGWRRPPVDAFIVLDDAVFAQGGAPVVDFLAAALRRLDGSDRLGVLLAGENGPEELLPLTRLDAARQALAQRVDAVGRMTMTGHQRPDALSRAMARAGELLAQAGESAHVVPGTQMVLVLSGRTTPGSVVAATRAAHTLTLQGAVTSVFSTGGEALPWWQLADAGYGNWHRLDEIGAEQAIEDEMAALARVVARLIRVNVRLGKGAHAVRVLGTRVLEAEEVRSVKAREVAADRSLSKSMGITADRGDDDDGIQTVIPYFLGDDSHVILIELWVEEPGVVADVSLRYKDMVNLENAVARTSVRLGSRPQPEAPEQQWIARNVRGYMLGEALQRASMAVGRDGQGAAAAALSKARNLATMTNEEDVRAVEAMQQMIENRAYAPEVLQENLMMSGQRRVGTTRR